MKMRVNDGTEIDAFEPGTRVRYRGNGFELLGRIEAWERHTETGLLSVLPYRVKWDSDEEASRLLGFMWLYPPPETLTREPETT